MGAAGLIGGAALGAIVGNNSGTKQKQSENTSQMQKYSAATNSANAVKTTSSSQAGSTSTTNNNQLTTSTPYQQQYQQGLLGAASNYAGNMPTEFYPGWDTVANLSPYQMLGMQSTAQAAEQQASYLPYATTTVMDMLSGQPNMAMYSPMMNMVREQITQGFKEDVLPAISSEALQYGGYGGAGHQQSLDIGAGRVAKELSNAETQMFFSAMQDAQNQRGMALQALPAISAMGYQPGQMLQGIGQTFQGQEQRELDANLQRYMANLLGPMDVMSWYANILGQDMGGTTAQTGKEQTSQTGWEKGSENQYTENKTGTQGWQQTTGTGSTSASTPGNPWQGALGGMAMAAALSDQSVKRNIRRIGTYRGHNLYEFEYIWGGGTHIGVIAQEVPHATYRVGHLLAVDYRRL